VKSFLKAGDETSKSVTTMCPIQTERSDQWSFEVYVARMMAIVSPKHVASVVCVNNN
jgi:hypothetical protein